MSQSQNTGLKMGGNKLKRPLIKEQNSGGDSRMGIQVLIELKLTNEKDQTESLPKIDELNS